MVLTDTQEAEMKSIFTKYANNGSVGSKEIGNASRAGGLNPTELDLSLWQGEAKKGFDLSAFQKFMGDKIEESGDSVEEIVEAFQSFDTGGTGMITIKELKVILTTMGEKMSNDEFQMLLDECDVEDGTVSYLQLSHMLFGATGDE